MIKTKEVVPGTKPRPKPFSLFKWIGIFIIGFVIFMSYEKFSDYVQKNADGTYELKQKRKEQLNEKVRRKREQAEVYYLVARKNGYYQCLHCPQGTFYLYRGEIWKIGLTTQGKDGRYKYQYLERMNLQYISIYKGNLQKASELELVEIGNYPLKPENISRPDKPKGEFIRYKLARPPGQNTDN